MFTKQDNDIQKQENQKFYEKQNQFIQENNLISKRNEYLNNEFFQYLVIQYCSNNYTIEEQWLFGKALDILIRKNITHRSFLNYNEETKQDFYSNAMYRCLNYACKTFKPEFSAFNYFTTTIRNAFKEEINTNNAQKKIAKKQYEQKGIESIMYNVDIKSAQSLTQEYIEVDNKLLSEASNIPYFKQLVIEKYGKEYEIKEISLVEDETASRFKRKYHKFDLFISVKKEKKEIAGKKINIETGLVIDYIDLKEVNETNGQYKTELQKRVLTARENGHQCFFLYSDVWNDKDIPDEVIFKKIDALLSSIKENIDYNNGNNLMINYIPYNLIKHLGYTEPCWWLLDEKLDNRHLVQDQGVQEYIKFKEESHSYTRVWDAGYLNKVR